MKYYIYFIMLLLNGNIIFGQNVTLQSLGCNSLMSKHYLEIGTESEFSLQLERELSPDIWVKHKQCRTKESDYIFDNLPDGNYRATLLDPMKSGNNEKVVEKISNSFQIDCINKLSYKFNNEIIDVFPNPACEILTLKFKKDVLLNCTFEITNPVGQLVKSGELPLIINTTNVQDLAHGPYIIKILSDGQITESQKLFIFKN